MPFKEDVVGNVHKRLKEIPDLTQTYLSLYSLNDTRIIINPIVILGYFHSNVNTIRDMSSRLTHSHCSLGRETS